MHTSQDLIATVRRRRVVVRAAWTAAAVVAVVITVASAIKAKESRGGAAPLARVSTVHTVSHETQTPVAAPAAAPKAPRVVEVAQPIAASEPVVEIEPVVEQVVEAQPEPTFAADTRWFDGRPVRPVRTITMTVTAYSPDHRSCGEFADGQTATLHSVFTNAMKLVAADPRMLPMGTMLSIDGYDGGDIVPVLDIGGAIKGNRLDVLFPTHEQAMEWGVREIDVVVYAYADGKPAPNPRKVR